MEGRIATENLLRILQQWLNGKKQLEKPELLDNVGSMTISHVVDAGDGTEHARRVNEWAESIWDAYADYLLVWPESGLKRLNKSLTEH